MKNIPTPDINSYKLKLIDKIEAVIKRMRWKMFWINNKENSDEQQPERYGFKSKKTPPPCPQLESFESDLLDLFENIEFQNNNDTFQRKLKEDLSNIRNSNKVFVFADKTSNIYAMPTDMHKKLLHENVTKLYEKAPPLLEASVNQEAKFIATSFCVDDRAESLAKSEAFITLKDHKENFHQKHPCRLINPCKSELGAISKSILDRINTSLRNLLQVNQWKNTDQVTEWFSSIEQKHECTFIQMDIKEFYPAITKEILENALNFASQYSQISEKELRTIRHCRKSLLFTNGEAWKKKKSKDCFDVTMGSFDGAEVCELVGIYILEKLTQQITDKENVGLYRDDGLMLTRNLNGRSADVKRKEIVSAFKEIGFDIEIQINLKTVDFLDVTLDLISETFRPYKKPNDQLKYVHTSSNHPKNILKQLPVSINRRLAKNSSNEDVFNKAKSEYEAALESSGYRNTKLTYKKPEPNNHRRRRKRNIIWFNPPYNKNVSTNVAKIFMKLINKHFTKENNLRKIFNKNNVKVSYSCTENVRSIINAHNKKVSSDTRATTKACNCRNKAGCPLNGNCRATSVIYKCEVTAPNEEKKVYIGLTEKEFKQRFNGHNQSFRNRKYMNNTTLSTHVWSLKDRGTVPNLNWSIIKHVKAYSNVSKTCRLCLQEKLEILSFENKSELLNKRSEIVAKCRHMNKYMLANYKSKD